MSGSIISVDNLSKNFRLKVKEPGFKASLKSLFSPKTKEIQAVGGLSFKVQQGEILAFIGPNGAGKSTTIKMLTGILFPSGGQIDVLGMNPSRQRQELAYDIGSVFGQKSQLWFHLPVLDSFNLFAKLYEVDAVEYQQRLDLMVEAFEIGKYLNVPVRKLSLGERMRCEIVASLLHRPKVIFLDEPTIGLDVIAKQHIREVIKYLNQKEAVTIFLTSHDAGDIETLAARTIVINHGTMVFDDTTENFKRRYIRSKTIELVVEGGTDKFEFSGGKILERGKYNLKVELDVAVASIERLLNYVVENFKIKDINIFEPEMEEIIAAIYREKRESQ